MTRWLALYWRNESNCGFTTTETYTLAPMGWVAVAVVLIVAMAYL